MLRNIAPKRLWELCLMYVMDTYFLMSHPIYTLDGRNIYEILTRDTPDISEFIEHYWYALVWYLEPGEFLGDDLKIGRWLGVAHHVGQEIW